MTRAKLYREVRYRSADDRLDLFARDLPAGKGDEKRIPLLMMHGLTRNSADFEPLIAALGAGNRRMVVPDQRGRGQSEYDPDPGNYRPDVYVQDMWVLLDRLGIDRVICIGTSMGGLMAMVMGAEQPNRIAGIILNDVGPEVSEVGLDRIRGYVGPSEPMASWEEAAARCEAINGGAMIGYRSDDWLAFAKRTCEELPDGRVRFAYDPAISASMEDEQPATVPPDLWTLWDALDPIPLLALRVEFSDILTQQTLAKMARRRSGKMDYAEVSDRGHAPLLDEPIAAAAIARFLAR